jgi:repressor LexA
MKNTLTGRQERVLWVILSLFEKEGRPPTTRELAAELRCHVKTVYQYVLILERKGYIDRRKGRIYPASELARGHGIPIVGRVAAGTPILAVENIEGVLSFEELFGKDDVFAVRVRGDSMKDAGILDGDLVIVQRSPTVPSGSIAICYLGDEREVTVKRFTAGRNRFELIPANEAYEPIRVAKDDPHFRVAGRVVGVVRRMR